MVAARHWHSLEGETLQCDLCPHACRLGEGATGRCRVRTVKNGVLYAASYGMISSAGLDPIEKKPLYHFRPGSQIFSIGSWGCNFSCDFCQNWTISQQAVAGGEHWSPAEVVAQARGRGSKGIAYTYNEPLVGFEFVMDVAVRARTAGLHNVLVTNGYLQPGPAAELLPLIDALNIDIKSMDSAFYRKHCGAGVGPVLAFAEKAVAAGCAIEVTNLLIPGLNDSDDAVTALAKWVLETLGEAVPLHLSAYRPQYRSRVPATPVSAVARAHALCSELLPYVYVGNILSAEGQNTVCPGCGACLVERDGYSTRLCGLDGGSCRACGRRADLVI